MSNRQARQGRFLRSALVNGARGNHGWESRHCLCKASASLALPLQGQRFLVLTNQIYRSGCAGARRPVLILVALNYTSGHYFTHFLATPLKLYVERALRALEPGRIQCAPANPTGLIPTRSKRRNKQKGERTWHDARFNRRVLHLWS